MRQLIGDINQLCLQFRECNIEIERRGEGVRIKEKLVKLYEIGCKKIEVSETELLLALLDAYEVIRDEEMLQKVLDVVSKNIDQLAVSAENVKLLLYCFYYVEEEECREKAREMLTELKKKDISTEQVEITEQLFREFAE